MTKGRKRAVRTQKANQEEYIPESECHQVCIPEWTLSVWRVVFGASFLNKMVTSQKNNCIPGARQNQWI